MIIDIFGYVIKFEVFKVDRKTRTFGRTVGGGSFKRACFIGHNGEFFFLLNSDGTKIPGQIDLTIESNLNALSTATMKCYVNGIIEMKEDADKPQ